MNRRKLANKVPYCMGCQKVNTGGEICLAHSNSLSDGKGIGLKAPDDKGSAYLCLKCHDLVDGRSGGWTKELKRGFLALAAERSRKWERENGH